MATCATVLVCEKLSLYHCVILAISNPRWKFQIQISFSLSDHMSEEYNYFNQKFTSTHFQTIQSLQEQLMLLTMPWYVNDTFTEITLDQRRRWGSPEIELNWFICQRLPPLLNFSPTFIHTLNKNTQSDFKVKSRLDFHIFKEKNFLQQQQQSMSDQSVIWFHAQNFFLPKSNLKIFTWFR